MDNPLEIKTGEIKDIRDEIYEYLLKDERTLAWLAKKLNISQTHADRIFVKKVNGLTERNLTTINTLWNKKFVRIEKETSATS